MKPVTDPAILAQLEEMTTDWAPGMRPVTDPNLLAQLEGAAAQGPAPYRATDDMSTGERLLAGYGRGVAELGQGAKQIALHTGGALGLVDPETVADYDRHVQEDARLYHNDLGATMSGKVGNFAGQLVTTAPIGGLEAIAGKSLLRTAVNSAVQGGATGLLQPVEQAAEPEVTLGDLVTGAYAEHPIEEGRRMAARAFDEKDRSSYLGDKLEQVIYGAGLGAGTNTVLRGAGSIIERALPRNLMNFPFRHAAGKETNRAVEGGAPGSAAQRFLDESDALTAETGVPFTPGQATGSKGLIAQEQRLRQSPKTADAVFAHDNAATAALDKYVQRLLRITSNPSRTPEEVGDLVRTAIRSRVGDIEVARRTTAAEQYGKVRKLAGDAPVLAPDNLRSALSEIIADYGDIATPGAEALSRYAGRMAESNLGDIGKVMIARRFLSRVAGGQARISGEPIDRKIAATLLDAIDNDLDASAQTLGGSIGEALRTANQSYRNFSSQIEYLRRSPLGKLLGEEITDTMAGGSYNTIPAERLLSKLKTMAPSEVSATRTMMQDIAPDAWQAMKRRVIEDALEAAQNAAPSQGANTLAMQPTAFVRALRGHTAEGQKWAKALLDPDELGQLRKAYAAALRLGDKVGFNHSGTAPSLEAGMEELANAASSNTTTGVARRAAVGIVRSINRKRLASAMADPKGRDAILKLQRLPPGSAKAREIAAYLSSLYTVQEIGDDPMQRAPSQ